MMCIFLFYNTKAGIGKYLYNSEFRNCKLIVEKDGHWLHFQYNQLGIIPRVLKVTSNAELLHSLLEDQNLISIIKANVPVRAYTKWKPVALRTCNEIARAIGGVNVGLTWTPRHLYNKLLKYDLKRNYHIQYHWRRSNGI